MNDKTKKMLKKIAKRFRHLSQNFCVQIFQLFNSDIIYLRPNIYCVFCASYFFIRPGQAFNNFLQSLCLDQAPLTEPENFIRVRI